MDSYISLMVKNFKMEESHNQSTRVTVGPYPQLVSGEGDKLDEADASLYRSIIGTLLFAANCLRYDICFAVGLLSRILQTPERNHISAAKRIFRYLNNNSLSITYGAASKVTFVGY